MLIELQKGVALQPGTFNAVLAPEEVIISAIDGLKISYPKVSDEQIKQLMAAKKKLEAE